MHKATIYGTIQFSVIAEDAESQAIANYTRRGYTCIGSTSPGYRVLQAGGGATAYMKLEVVDVVYVVSRGEAHMGVSVEHVFKSKDKADHFVDTHAHEVDNGIDYWQIKPMELE